ncbi:pectin methylesterase Pme8B [Lachnospira eligens CAG:72]|uniref:Pectin methylesterase Pme8B n=1 Tax=Lachnospira eligens CAG:72 TaxID=1263077 RepID=R6AK98_9FIRM|nr:pectin methylesterase Pme8B [[Eubacterium] eligens CAG:72]
MKKGKRILAAFLAVLMVVAIMPFTSFSGIFTSKAKAAESGKKYTFEGTELEAAAAGKYTDGQAVTAGTDGYFTFYMSAKTKIDSSDKTWEDGYACKQRVNFGGKADVANMKNLVSFKTSNAAKVKVYWVEGGTDNRQMAIFNSTGDVVTKTEVTAAKNDPVVSTLELADAGTYYLGGLENNNYIFKIEVEETAAVEEPVVKEYELDGAKLETAAAGKFTDGQTVAAGTDNAFTLYMSAKTKIDSSSKTWDDGFAGTQRINFGGKADIANMKNFVSFKTEGTAKVKIYWVEGGTDNRQMAIFNSTGDVVTKTEVTAAKNDPVVSTLELADAGTYYLGGLENNNYIFKVVVTDTVGGDAPVVTRKNWSEVAAPVIGEVAQDGANVTVPFTMVLGNDGADKVSVVMTDASGNTETKGYALEGEGGKVSFSPASSGEYTFTITASRENEQDKTGNTVKLNFAYPLSAPSISSATSMGNGTVSLVWQSVKEATSYNVYVGGTKVGSTSATSYDVTGLTVGTKYDFAVEAVRETPAAVSDKSTISATATAEAKQVWGYIVYGNGASESNSAYEGNINETGSVTLRSGAVDANGVLKGSGNNGKLVPASFDGLNFYYTAVPTSLNFTLRAKVTVDQWSLSNGQEGFGLMAADRLGGSGWNNSYMAVVSKTEYYWNEEAGKVTNDTTALKVSQKIGIASQEKKGLTKDNIAAIEANDTETVKQFQSAMYPLEQRYAQNVNVIGNAVKPVDATIENPVTEMYLTIQKNNTGYFVSYESVDGTYSTTKKYYDTETLSQLDSDNVYVGFFTSRYAQATFSDVTFTTINPSDDAPAEEKPIEELVTNAAFNSKTATGSSDYEFRFTANCDGVLSIWDSEDNAIATDVAVAANTVVKPATTTLNVGKNSFRYVFTPDAGYIPEKDMVMSSYEPIEGTFTVTYRTYGVEGQSIYVAPGKYGVGTKEDPMSIYDAVKYVQPGQTIVVMEGTYYLEKTVKVERGVNGTADKPIQMVADTEASSRPVFDFQGLCAGMVLAGDYWYFQGFDVTNSANAQKGIQLSGKYNTMDNIMTYHNGNTGLQVSRYLTTDEFDMWPAYNLILNCTSYGNADAGYEDADGFAAKLTVGDGNVFDGCISYNNADDGWDLFAKVQSGSIGAVTIKNSVAYGNGYLEDGTNAGNGNGFKLGGDSMSGKHVLENCVAFDNKAKGIDSNSCPDINVINCTTFNNESYNIALYTNSAKNTDFSATGVLSYRTYMKDNVEQFKLLGTQDKTKVDNDTNYFWNYEGTAKNSAKTVTDDWFESVDTAMDHATHVYASHKVTRNADNTINMNGLLVLTDKAAANTGARMTGTPSAKIEVPEGIKGHKTISITGKDVVKGNTTDVAVIQGTSTDIVWTIDADASTFDYIMVDDVVLDASKYTVVANGNTTVVTFKASYIKSLKAAEHTFRACFTDGYIAETKLEVLPKTGDFSRNMIAVYAGIMLMALLAAAVVLFEKKRKRV